MFKTPDIPSLKHTPADATPNSKVLRPTFISFGQPFHTTLLIDSLLFWVFPCKHLLKRFSSLRSKNIGLILSRITLGSPGFFFYTGLFHYICQPGTDTSYH